MTYDTFKARFYSTVPLFVFPDDAVVGIPQFISSAGNVWHFKWAIEFQSTKDYIYCREAWSSRKGNPARRWLFSLHYGPGPQKNINGEITYNHADPVVLRIDKKNGEPEHLHYLNPEPHYEQVQVKGLIIDNIDMYAFVSAVLQHRSSGTDLHRILGFEVG